MLMSNYIRVLLKCSNARRRSHDLEAVMYQGQLMAVIGVCVAHEHFPPQLGVIQGMRDLEYPNVGRCPVDLLWSCIWCPVGHGASSARSQLRVID